MRLAGLDRKVAPADADHALGIGGPEIGDLAIPDHPGEGIGVVAGQLGGMGQGEELFAPVSEGSLDLQGRPLERAGWGSAPKASRNSLALARMSATAW